MTEHLREELGAYVLEALEHDEAQAVREHLATCPSCREEHDRLAALPHLLALADRRATATEPPASLEAAVVASYRRQPPPPKPPRASRWRWWRPALAGAVAGAAATLAVVGLLGDGDAREVILRGDGAMATARLTEIDAGTQVELEVEGLPPTRGDEVYELWFGGPNQRVSAGTFAVGPDRSVKVTLTCGAPPPTYGRIGVTREPDRRDPAGNGPAVLRAQL